MIKPGSFQYILYARKTDPEAFYVWGTFNETFKDVCLKPARARWDPKNKHWVIQKEHLSQVRHDALATFETVYYGEGGDYVTL